ncbi:hypothetical protein FQZ97_974540 [compost metagenome]
MAARLEAQPTVGTGAGHAQHHFLVAAEFAGRLAHGFNLPALALGVAGVQARQVAGKQRRFVAPCPRADFYEGVALVVRVFGQKQLLQLGVELGHVRLSAVDFLAGHVGHVGVREHFGGRGQVRFAPQVAVEHLDHG